MCVYIFKRWKVKNNLRKNVMFWEERKVYEVMEDK